MSLSLLFLISAIKSVRLFTDVDAPPTYWPPELVDTVKGGGGGSERFGGSGILMLGGGGGMKLLDEEVY